MSLPSVAELKALVEGLAPACNEAGVRRIRVGDIELEFGAARVSPEALDTVAKALKKAGPTDEDLLNWSAPNYVPSFDLGGEG